MVRAALALVLVQPPLTPAPDAFRPPDAEIVVLATGGPEDPVADRTVRLIEALEADGRLVYARPSFDGEACGPPFLSAPRQRRWWSSSSATRASAAPIREWSA
jgi:hypothetical protein